MKWSFVFSLSLSLGVATVAVGTAHGNDGPLVDGMVTMMEHLGLIDRGRLPPGTHYLPSAGAMSPYGFGGVPGMNPSTGLGSGLGLNPMTGLGGVPGMNPSTGLGSGLGLNPMTGLGGVPGMNPFTGLGGGPGFNPITGLGGVPGMNPITGQGPIPGGWPGAAAFGYPGAAPWANPAQNRPTPGLLDGVWELNNGGFVIIRADSARLYVAEDRYQDFLVRYDDKHFWWRPRDGSKFQRYRYEMREGRMVLADNEGRLLLLRRRQ